MTLMIEEMAGLHLNNRLKYYSREINNDGILNMLLVSTSQTYLDKLAMSINSTRDIQRKKRPYNLRVNTCKSIIDVLQLMPREFYVDFIVFVLDTHIGQGLIEMENNLNCLDTSFTREKICLVNPDFQYSRARVSPTEIWEFAKSHQINLINGKTKDQKGIFHLTKRILNLAEACCGILNGIPMINAV